MNVHTIHDRIAPTSLRDPARIRIIEELQEILQRLGLPDSPSNDPCIQLITAWCLSYTRTLFYSGNNNYAAISQSYVVELERIFQSPTDATFPIELFGNRPLPLIRYLVARMRDPRSVIYSQRLDQQANQILAQQQQTQDRLRAQLRRIETQFAANRAAEAQAGGDMQALRERIRQRESAFQERADAADRRMRERSQQLRHEIEQAAQRDQEQRAIRLEAARKLRQEIEEVNIETRRLQHQLDGTRAEIREIDRANTQLQVEINQLRSEIADKKAGWLEQLGCIALSIAVSWILEKPVIITPHSVTVG